MRRKASLTILLSGLLALAPAAPAATPAVVGKINVQGTAEVNGSPMPSEATVFAGDRIETRKDSVVSVSMPGGNQLFLPEWSTAQVSRKGSQVTVLLERGALAVLNRSGESVVTQADGVRIRPAEKGGAMYEVTVNGNSLQVQARKGTALVEGSNRTVEVKEGTTLEATVSPETQTPVGASRFAGLSAISTALIVTSIAVGIAGLTVAAVTLNRPNPKDCRTTGSVSPFTLTCD